MRVYKTYWNNIYLEIYVSSPERIRTAVVGSKEPFSTEKVSPKTLNEFLKLREIEGLSDKWVYEIEKFVTNYLNFVNWEVDKTKTLEYLTKLGKRYSVTGYRKKLYQIRKFLDYINVGWAKQINPPQEPEHIPKRVTTEDIQNTLTYFRGHEYYKQTKALVLLGCNSGMRAEELYQLEMEDIDLENRIVKINHNPDNGQTTKTKHSRVSFFTEETKQALTDYFEFYNKNKYLKCLWNQSHIERMFRDAPMRVKELRKYFSQMWDRNGGQTSIKKILMGNSTRNDVDLQHYN